MDTLIFQPIQESELSILRTISLETFQNTYAHLNDPAQFEDYLEKAFSPEQIAKEWQQENTCFYFVRSGESIVGYFKLNFAHAEGGLPATSSIELERIYVLPEEKGKGIGSAMIQESVRLGKEKHFQWIWLGVWNQNTAAIRFYKKNGFQIYGEHDFVIGTDIQKDWLMKREIV